MHPNGIISQAKRILLDTSGSRLRSERQRLRLSQEQLAAIGGVKRVAQGHYEKGARFPDAAYLARVADAGVDVLYVVTGAARPTDRAVDPKLFARAGAALDAELDRKAVPSGTRDLCAAIVYNEVCNLDGGDDERLQALHRAAKRVAAILETVAAATLESGKFFAVDALMTRSEQHRASKNSEEAAREPTKSARRRKS